MFSRIDTAEVSLLTPNQPFSSVTNHTAIGHRIALLKGGSCRRPCRSPGHWACHRRWCWLWLRRLHVLRFWCSRWPRPSRVLVKPRLVSEDFHSARLLCAQWNPARAAAQTCPKKLVMSSAGIGRRRVHLSAAAGSMNTNGWNRPGKHRPLAVLAELSCLRLLNNCCMSVPSDRCAFSPACSARKYASAPRSSLTTNRDIEPPSLYVSRAHSIHLTTALKRWASSSEQAISASSKYG